MVAAGARDARGRPPSRDVAAVFGLGVIGVLIPVVGWLVGVWLVARGTSWSAGEKLLGLVGPIVALLAAVATAAVAFGADVGVPVLAAVPLTLSVGSGAGAIFFAFRLVAHRRAAERAAR